MRGKEIKIEITKDEDVDRIENIYTIFSFIFYIGTAFLVAIKSEKIAIVFIFLLLVWSVGWWAQYKVKVRKSKPIRKIRRKR